MTMGHIKLWQLLILVTLFSDSDTIMTRKYSVITFTCIKMICKYLSPVATCILYAGHQITVLNIIFINTLLCQEYSHCLTHVHLQSHTSTNGYINCLQNKLPNLNDDITLRHLCLLWRTFCPWLGQWHFPYMGVFILYLCIGLRSRSKRVYVVCCQYLGIITSRI